MSATRAPSAFHIERVMSVWQQTRASIMESDPELIDDELSISRILGPIEGEVRDVIARLLRASRQAKAMEDAADRQMADLTERRDRYRKRADDTREAAGQIMEIIGDTRLELPDLTASFGRSQPPVVITDEAQLPDEYWRVTRAPDKRLIGDDLKQGVVIDGAMLGNPKSSLRIRGR